MLSGVSCNSQDSSGFTFTAGAVIRCTVGNTTIATFATQQETTRDSSVVEKTVFKLEESQELSSNENAKTNALYLVNANDSCSYNTTQLCLSFNSVTDRARFESLYQEINQDVTTFSKQVIDEVENNAATNKAPSTHTSPVVAVTTSGTSVDLSKSFVAANAEQFYEYKPTEVILSEGKLVNSSGQGIAGVEYYSDSGRGITDSSGTFAFNWGETVTFGIDTFELGSVRVNKSTVQLSDLGGGVWGSNVESLVSRYASSENGNLKISDTVRDVFAQYPNVINNIIDLSLSNGGKLSTGNGGDFIELTNEFSKQFESGQAKVIDDEICLKTRSSLCTAQTRSVLSAKTTDVNNSNTQKIINKLWGIDTADGYKKVEKFHVFHDSTNFYGSTGNARGQAVINVSNAAQPVMMARNDKNYWIPLGELRAWDKNGLAYITESPSKEEPENMTADAATFNLPFISLGSVGNGKLMVMGNQYYNSILRCPNGYSWGGGVKNDGTCKVTSDPDDMKHFMQNVLRYLLNEGWSPEQKNIVRIGTNLDLVYFKTNGQQVGDKAEFAFDSVAFGGLEATRITSYSDIDPGEMPLLILNGFEYLTEFNGNDYEIPLRADINKPKLSQQDVTNLISYLNKGGSILIMENVMSDLSDEKASAFSRLLDAAGLSMSLNKSVVTTDPQGYPNLPRQRREHTIWVYERYPSTDGKNPYSIDKSTGKVTWTYQKDNKPDDKPSLELASWQEEDGATNKFLTKYAFIDADDFEAGNDDTQRRYKVSENNSNYNSSFKGKTLREAKDLILGKFDGLKECSREKNSSPYDYEINCLEQREGSGIPVTGGMYVPRYTLLSLDEQTAKAMVKAADLGTNIERLYQHEIYFRTKGKEGTRLSSVDLERLYQNMSVWLWNDQKYTYDDEANDDLGFKTFTEFLACYTNNKEGSGSTCPSELKKSLEDNGMLESDGKLNPSYPLNYMEKPLTRLMLGRSWWDLNIQVDVDKYPGKVTDTGETGNNIVEINLYSNPTKWFAGNMQSTGLWAPAQKEVTVSCNDCDNENVTITVGLADDLTGLEKHEVNLNRPPRVTKTYTLSGAKSGGENSSVRFTVPYGGLIYIQGNSSTEKWAKFTLTGVVKAPYYKNGSWVHDITSPAPIGEVETKYFVYTAPKNNLKADNYNGDIKAFADELDTFACVMNDFYARDGESTSTSSDKHRKFTFDELSGHKHRFVNDVQISIGSAHSGYPVMNTSFSGESTMLPTTPLDDWLIWHEVGHNAAEAPLNVTGATEVANNVLALYMQDRYLGKMKRVEGDITVAPEYLNESDNQAWARGGAGDRLLMFAQLKEWAEKNFDIRKWYPESELPAFYSEREGMKGWNMFQLMHRLARGGDDLIKYPAHNRSGVTNYCQYDDGNAADTLMLCASWVAQKDFSEFFKKWNPGATSYQLPGKSELSFQGGISQKAYEELQKLNLTKPEEGPERINKVTESKDIDSARVDSSAVMLH